MKHGEEYRYTVGRSTDAMMGLVAEGLFGKDVAINGHAPQRYFYDNLLVILLYINCVCSCKSKEYLLLSFTYFDYMCSKCVPLNKELYTRYFNLGTKIMNKIVF